MYEIFFISYDEPNADRNWDILKSRFPIARRIHGVNGILEAHKQAAKRSFTKMFYVVDGDAEVLDTFNFDHRLEDYDTVCVWHSKNPVNDLEYGYGGIKLLPKKNVLDLQYGKVDMTTSLSTKLKIISEVSNITAFNTDPFNTWKSAFRECVKLSSKVIDRSYDEETEHRLDKWCKSGQDRLFGDYCIAGAKAGRDYGQKFIGNREMLYKINDFDWLRQKFKETYE